MKRKVLIGGGIIAVLLGTAVAAPAFIDWNKYKGQIVTQLHNATGHDYDIGGPLSLSILPLPHVVVSGLSVRAPAAQGGASLLTLDKADVSVELLPLLSGKVNIRSITLEKPVFNVGIDKDGTPSWMTPKLQPQQKTGNAGGSGNASPSSVGDKVVLQSVNIHNGAFRFEDRRSGAIYAAQDIDMKVKADTLFGPYSVDGGLEYNNEKIDVEIKTGAIGKGADSVAVQLKIDVPSAHGAMQFAGVAGMKAPYQIQGETTLAADNFAALLKPFVKAPLGNFDKAMMVKGLLTYTPDSFALRNAQLAYGDAELDGDIAVSGMKQSQANVQVNLAAAKPVNLDAFMAQHKPAAVASAAQEKTTGAAATSGFLPQTISLPFQMGGKIAVAFKSVAYKGQSFTDAGLAVALTPKVFTGQMKAGLPGKGTADGTFTLSYASAVKNAAGGVTLGAPSMIYKMQVRDQDPKTLLGAFVPPDQLKAADAVLAAPLAVDVAGTVTPSAIAATSGALNIANMNVAFSGSYKPKASQGRDAIALVVSTDRIDADQWIKQPASAALNTPVAQNTPSSQPAAKSPDIAATLRSFSLPFDLDLGATVKLLRYSGNDYANVSMKGKLAGGALDIANAGFQDQAGNMLRVSGTVADIKTLGGIDISLNGKTPDANLLLKTLKVDASAVPANAGPAEAVAEFKGQADKLGFTANLKVLRGTLEASGSLADLLTRPSFGDLTFRLRHPDYESLVRLYSPAFHASVNVSKTLDLFASMQRAGNVYSLKQIKATVGPAAMQGDVTIDMGAGVPSLTASLQFTSLPLDKLLGAEATTNTGSTATIRPASLPGSKSGGGHWSREAINTSWMHKWNADIKTTAGDVSYGNWRFSNAALDFDLKNGTLTLTKLDGGLYGGHIAMTAKMASGAANAPLDANAAIKLDNVSIQSFVQSFSGSSLIKAQGTINMDSTLNAKGESPAALISALQGKGALKGGDLVFQGFDLARLSGALAQPSGKIGQNFANLLGAATSGGSTRFDTLDGAYTVTAGVINFDKMQLTGPDATVATAGTVNLPLWTVDLQSTITLPEPKDNPPPPLKVVFKGPLDSPAQTFGQGAMENYFMQQYGSKLQKQLDKLDKKGVLGKSGLGSVLGGVLGLPQQPAAVPVTAPAATKTITAAPLNPAAKAAPVSAPATIPAAPPAAQAAPQAAAIPAPVPEAAPVAPIPASEPVAATVPEPAQAPAAASAPVTTEPAPAADDTKKDAQTPPAQ